MVTVSLSRRHFLGTLAGLGATLGLAACSSGQAQTSASILASTAPLPTTVPPGTSLTVAGPDLQLQLQLSGLMDTLPFTVPSWPNIAAGPDVINAFRANSLDVGKNAGIPPIQSYYQGGLDAKIVAVNLTRKPTYVFVTRPHSDIQSVADFRGKSLAFSQGQAQGVVLLRALKEAGLNDSDVSLVPLTSDQFLTALQAGQVDIAPLGITNVNQYLNQFSQDGAHEITTDVVDLLSILWAPGKVLTDSAKVAAIAALIPFWARALVWAYENPDTWVQEWYVKNQGITQAQGEAVVALSNKPLFPPTWDEAIAWEQETIGLLSEGGYINQNFTADVLFDRRFESLAANAVDDMYRI